jgi:hypothetical protein
MERFRRRTRRHQEQHGVRSPVAPHALAYHYTVGVRMESILNDGLLLPATAGVPAGEKPAVWFTLRSTGFEPTARKMVMEPGGELRSLSVEETEALADGLYRIGVDATSLLDFEAYKALSGVDPRMLAALIKAAQEEGSDPAEWMVSFDAVPRGRWRSVELYLDGAWVSV